MSYNIIKFISLEIDHTRLILMVKLLMKYLVTGSAGFIGFYVSKRLLENGHIVVGIDNLNNYYDPQLKKDRLKILSKFANFIFYKKDISNLVSLEKIFIQHQFDKVCNLAAQAGVRHSIDNPFLYEKSNIQGFLNILEMIKKYQIKDIVYASSSSVYGGIKETPFREDMKIDQPISIYAVTKATNELMANAYHNLYGINTVGLRFFTVYGPWGRPDMAYFSFTKLILNNKPIQVFNSGQMKRDFTYIDDIVDGIVSALDRTSVLKNKVINLGNSHPVNLLDFIDCLENNLKKVAKKEFLPLQSGDVLETYADISLAQKTLDFKPKINIQQGLKNFTDWYLSYFSSK